MLLWALSSILLRLDGILTTTIGDTRNPLVQCSWTADARRAAYLRGGSPAWADCILAIVLEPVVSRLG